MKTMRCVLANPGHKLPMPDRGGRLFKPEGETVDVEDPFWMALLRDGSIRPEEKRAPQKAPKAAKAASEPTNEKG